MAFHHRRAHIDLGGTGETRTDGDRPSFRSAGGLRKPGVALCHQVTTLDRAKLTEWIGTLPVSALTAVEGGLRAALGFE
jgi:mRNA-degrading endonuclease toxin of MazEF toxin-antitoxin module